MYLASGLKSRERKASICCPWYRSVVCHQTGHAVLSIKRVGGGRKEGKGKEDKADRGRGGKTTSGNGQALSSPSPRGQWRTGKNGENWWQNHMWCPNDPRG